MSNYEPDPSDIGDADSEPIEQDGAPATAEESIDAVNPADEQAFSEPVAPEATNGEPGVPEATNDEPGVPEATNDEPGVPEATAGEPVQDDTRPQDDLREDDSPDAPPHDDPFTTPPSGAAWTPPAAGYAASGGYYSAPEPRRLFLSNDRKVGGVAGGIAEYFNVDPTLVRLAVIIFAFSGIGLVAYLVAWLIVPERPANYVDPQTSSPAFNERTLSIAFGIFGIALAAGFVTDSFEAFAIALIAGGIWLLSERTPTLAPAGAVNMQRGFAPTPATGGPMAFSPTSPSAPPPGTAPMQQFAPPASVPPREPPAPRKPQTITWVVLSTLALLAAFGIAAASGDWWDVSMARFWGVGLIIIGVGVILGQLRGGGRGLLPIGILAALALLPISVADDALSGGFGEERYRPTTVAELRESYELGVGQLTVDLSALELNGADADVDIDLGIGELIVIVPASAGGTASVSVDAGEFFNNVEGQFSYEDGVTIGEHDVRFSGDDGTLTLDIDVGLGVAELLVERN